MKRTNLLRGNNARAMMNYLKSIGIPFEMQCSNYTVLFKADGLEKKYVHSMQSGRAFGCFAKLQKDVKNKPVPEIDMESLSYFVHDFKESVYVGDVFNIDLKSAYATILYLDGYITTDTYNYICAGTKQERLVSVGMLASKKQLFKFDGGYITSNEEIISPFSNFFFYAVKRTSEIMAELKAICGQDYLFTWVDGIYLHPNKKTRDACIKYIQSIGMRHSFDELKDFEVKVDTKQVSVYFLKESKGKWQPKPFNLPLPTSEFKRLAIDAILSRKRKSKKDVITSLYRKQNIKNDK
jgi:hypothetical protein